MRHLDSVLESTNLYAIITHCRQNTWPHAIACGVLAAVAHVYGSKQTSHVEEGCTMSMKPPPRLNGNDGDDGDNDDEDEDLGNARAHLL